MSPGSGLVLGIGLTLTGICLIDFCARRILGKHGV